MTRPLVVALVTDGFHPFELGVACEVFGIDRRALVPAWYRFRLASDGSQRSSFGPALSGLGGLDVVARADLVVVPGWEGLETPPSARVLAALRRAAKRGARIVSFCSGAFALAHAGLLDGRRASTHWLFADRLAARFPRVMVDARPLWTVDGNIWTAAGTAAAIDCGLAVVAADFGQTVANQVARRMVAAPVRAGGQAQFIERPLPPAGDRLEPVRQFVLAHLDQKHEVATLARRAAMSPRSFARHFVATMGTTPHAWLLGQRVERARLLLERGGLSFEEIATRVGSDATNLRLRFRRLVGMTPTAYRNAFAQTPAMATRASRP